MVETFKSSLPFLLRGIEVTIKISVVSILLGIVIGLFACLLKLSKNKFCRGVAAVSRFFVHESFVREKLATTK